MNSDSTNAAVRDMKRQLGTGTHRHLDFGLVSKIILLTPFFFHVQQISYAPASLITLSTATW
jgi:hypothetical protein